MNGTRGKPRGAYLDNLELVKYLNDIFADHHGAIGVLSIHVLPVGTIGIRPRLTPDVLEVLLQFKSSLLLQHVP